MNDTTKKILGIDPVATADALIGIRHDNFKQETNSMVTLGLAILTNEVNSNHLESIGDTYYGIRWSDFINIVKSYGFKSGFCQKFTDTDSFDKEEEEIIFFHEEKGLILYANSYEMYVNTAKVYGEIKMSGDQLKESERDALDGCFHYINGNGTISFDVDVRQGFRYHLNAISEAFEFSKVWTTDPFLLSFLNSMDTEDEDCNYEKINEQKIDACTPEVKKIIFEYTFTTKHHSSL